MTAAVTAVAAAAVVSAAAIVTAAVVAASAAVVAASAVVGGFGGGGRGGFGGGHGDMLRKIVADERAIVVTGTTTKIDVKGTGPVVPVLPSPEQTPRMPSGEVKLVG